MPSNAIHAKPRETLRFPAASRGWRWRAWASRPSRRAPFEARRASFDAQAGIRQGCPSRRSFFAVIANFL
eukprot:3690786-Alexandrium_andersonii.AAC.1